MSDLDDWEFEDDEDAKMTIRAAVRYLLKGTTDGARGDIVQAIIGRGNVAPARSLRLYGSREKRNAASCRRERQRRRS
jgi:hypothetical protein